MSVPNRSALNDCSASLLIKTPSRELKLTAPDMERHALWYKVWPTQLLYHGMKRKHILIVLMY